jgi:protein-S-isoprenylcysteine O-methyltransferase Ste14
MTLRESIGYLVGFLLFVAGIPALMWLVSGRPFPWAPALPWAIPAILLIIIGLALSIWSIVHMKKVGEGNPMDAYNHEVAPRTKHLMTDGPYRFTRNPMLLGIYIYDIGLLLWLHSWWPLLVFAVEVVFLTLQVRSEEKRLKADFGDEYRSYKSRVPRYLLK